jgi:prepilin-type N-terminal cleavage/methylation domain-containing protein
MRNSRRAITLLELLVVLTILGLMLLVVSAGGGGTTQLVRPDSALMLAGKLRDEAIKSGRRTTGTIATPDGVRRLTALPDGRLISGEWLRVDQLTGRRVDDPR